LPGVRRVFFDDQYVIDVRGCETRIEPAQLRFVADVQRDCVRAWREISVSRVAGSVNQLGGLRAEGEIGANDAVVRQKVGVNALPCRKRYRDVLLL